MLLPTITRRLIAMVAGDSDAGAHADHARNLLATLSPRERDVATALGRGHGNAQIAVAVDRGHGGARVPDVWLTSYRAYVASPGYQP